MFASTVRRTLAVTSVAAILGFGPAFAQVAPIPSEQVPIDVDSGVVHNTASDVELVYSTVVEVPGALWLRLNFEEVQLSGSIQAGDESYLLITSLEDDAVQYLNALHVRQWKNTSAYFNGDAVLVELFAHPDTGENRIVMNQVTVGVFGTDTQTICGPTDDRELSDDPRAGRLLPIGCTAWIITDCNHCMLSAGHCSAPGSANTLEFNVPLSDQFGNIQHPGPEDQYAVDDSSIQFVNGGVGNDWGYWGVFPNTNTGLTPFEAQGDAFTVVEPPAVSGQNIRITGYGTTSSPVPPQWNQVQKTHAGPYFSFAGTTVRYTTDTTGGNSGSPVIDDSTGLAIGIHTHGGCTSGGSANHGTGANHSGLQAALAAPLGVCAAPALGFNYPDGLPDLVDPLGGTTIRVEMLEQNGVFPEPGTGMLHYDNGDGFIGIAMTEVSENVYDATFPELDCTSEVAFFFSAESTGGDRYYDPGGCNPPPGANAYQADVDFCGELITMTRNDTAPDSGADLADFDRNSTHFTFDLIIDSAVIPSDWTAAEVAVDVVGPGVIWHASDETDLGDTIGNLNVPFLDASSTDTKAFDTFLSVPTSPFFVTPSLAAPGGVVSTDTRIRGLNSGGDEIPLAWFDTVSNPDGVTFVALRTTFELDSPGDLTLGSGDELFATITGAVVTPYQEDVFPFDYEIYRSAGGGCPNPGCDLGDLDGDCDVDIEDLSILLGEFGTTYDLEDLASLLSQFGNDCN